MKTLEQILEYQTNTLDGRDASRLAEFVPVDQWSRWGFTLKEGAEHTPLELTREAVLERLKSDLDFAFEKALGKRGLSAAMMRVVVKMWVWVLDEEPKMVEVPPTEAPTLGEPQLRLDPEHDLTRTWDDVAYQHYGLPLLKAVALKYGLENCIGEHVGDEQRFAE